MKLLQKIRDWFNPFRLAKHNANDVACLRKEIIAVLDTIRGHRKEVESVLLDQKADWEAMDTVVDQLNMRLQELYKQNERLEWELEALREKHKYQEEMLIPSMTQAHARVMSMLEAETAIEIRRQVVAKD